MTPANPKPGIVVENFPNENDDEEAYQKNKVFQRQHL